MSRHIKASEFNAKCLALMDEVARTGIAVIITKNGKPVAELVPHRPRKQSARGILKDELFITGDIISPIDVECEALKRSCLAAKRAALRPPVRSTAQALSNSLRSFLARAAVRCRPHGGRTCCSWRRRRA